MRWVECPAVKSSPIADEINGEAMRAAIYYDPRDLRPSSLIPRRANEPSSSASARMRSRASSRKWLSAAIRSMGGSRRSCSRASSSRAARIDAETRRLAAQGWAVRGEVVDVCDHASIECAFDAALAARLMRPQRSGRMIVTTSVAAYQCEPAISAAYMTAKAGAAHLMRSVALELAADNITVNAIAPGFLRPILAAAMRRLRASRRPWARLSRYIA